ncbi:MAG: hypothetical protein J0H57_14920 [Rhodospirillales bacterium]|nr:hypothetical protein [Rhodospirillales bacterium]
MQVEFQNRALVEVVQALVSQQASLLRLFADIDAIAVFAQWLSMRRTLAGLLIRMPGRGSSALEYKLHACHVPTDSVDRKWLYNERTLFGLLRRSVVGGPATAESFVFARMVRTLLDARRDRTPVPPAATPTSSRGG